MQICFSILDADSEILQMPTHFGESAHFLLIDSTSGKTRIHPASDLPCRGPCSCYTPARQKQTFGAVICRAIGHLELRYWQSQGIPIYLTPESSPFAAQQRWRENQLQPARCSICFKGRRKSAQTSIEARHIVPAHAGATHISQDRPLIFCQRLSTIPMAAALFVQIPAAHPPLIGPNWVYPVIFRPNNIHIYVM